MDEFVEARIKSLTNEGDGVARPVDMPVIFIPFTAPGDLVRARVTSKHKRFWRAEVADLIEPGPGRAKPICAAFGRCGGCRWQHLEAEVQLAAKQKILADALQRIAGIKATEQIPMTASPSGYDYRARARVVAKDGVLGYRERGSRKLCPVESCPILLPALRVKWQELIDSGKLADGEWELRWGLSLEGEQQVDAVPLAATRSKGELLAIPVGSDRVTISPGGFFQANSLLLDALADAVWAAAGQGERLLELFCGSGFFTLGLARRFKKVMAVESSRSAMRDLQHNLERARLSNVKWIKSDVEQALRTAQISAFAPEVVLLDPPRTGLDKDALQCLLDLKVARVVYLSCDPATLARDLSKFRDRGYELCHLEGFDLFPQTPHVEVLAALRVR